MIEEWLQKENQILKEQHYEKIAELEKQLSEKIQIIRVQKEELRDAGVISFTNKVTPSKQKDDIQEAIATTGNN